MNHSIFSVETRHKSYRLLFLLFSLLLLIPLQQAAAQPAGDDEAILYMAYDDTPEGVILIVSPEGYRAVEMGRDWYGSDSSGRYQRGQMVASDDGRWLAVSVQDTVDNVLLWLPIMALEGGGGNTIYPPLITQAIKLGSFSPDGRYLSVSLVGQESPDSPLIGRLIVFDVTISPESDEQFMWWLPLEPREGQIMWAELGDWDGNAVQFLPTCYDCDETPAGEYSLWDPFTGMITPETGVQFVADVNVLKATGEALRLEYDEAFPLNPDATGANVVRYMPEVTADATAMTTIYTDPRGIALAQWVLDGEAVLVQPAGVYDLWVLIYRDGRVVEYPYSLGIRFVVGSPDGWFVEAGNADGYTDIRHVQLESWEYSVSAAGGATVIRPPYLGANLPDPAPAFSPVTP